MREQKKLDKRQIQKLKKKLGYHKNKENKFLFFLFTLQNKGVPVNDIYESEGIKNIPTERFAEILGDENRDISRQSSQSIIHSFYTDDSYELITQQDPTLKA